jgi:pyrroline-5-carboxylate reductase
VLEGCGDIIEIEDESKIRILSVTSATMSSFLQYQVTAIEWAVKCGLDLSTSRDYMASLYKCLAVETTHTELDQVVGMPREHETPGGLNEYMRESLTKAGFYDTMTESMDFLMFKRNLAKAED